ncbi:methionine--tRNA ligase [bacterium]|nr:methionine--tRNA ligase [bacterium]
MQRPFYITTPIYYVNARPHIGHAYTTIAADVIARWHRLAGRETYFLTGTDEHGSKVAEAAAKAGLTEQEFCDRTAATFVQAWENLGIRNNDFIRTTSPRHIKAVRKILDAMRAAKTADGQDVVYSDYYEGLYCTGCEKFLTEKELVDGKCPYHRTEPEKVREKNYFFRLTAFLPTIRARIESGELRILPEERRREVLGLIDQELGDFSLSRERVTWGIPLTFDDAQVAYVWVDALSNYISAIGYADDREMFDKWWTNADVVHLMAKDILKFHCLYWPAMLLAAGEKLPETLFLHGFFTVDGEKMSKSLGNQIDPNDMVAEFGADASRYLVLTQYPFGVDGDIQASRFVTQYNSDLANDLGNLVSRVVKLIQAHCDSKIPASFGKADRLDVLQQIAAQTAEAAYAHITEFRLHAAIAEGLTLCRATNKFFNDTAPWKMAKAGKFESLDTVLYSCCEALRIISVVLWPVMPAKMNELREVFGLDESGLTLDDATTFGKLQSGGEVKLAKPLFPRLEKKKDKPDAGAQSDPNDKGSPNEDGLLDISEFGKVQLRVAQVLTAEKVEKADKLLKLQVDLGSEQRQIVAGIAQHYSPEQMVGRKVIVVANLKPAKIRGIESRGMLLAAKSKDSLYIVTPDGDLPPGSGVS